MKKIVFILTVFTLFFTDATYGQEIPLPDSIYTMIQKDDSVKLSKSINKKNINLCYWNTYTILAHAIRNKAIKCFEMLLNKGANVNETCIGKAPVYLVVKYGDLEMLKKMAKKNANLNPPPFEGESLLVFAEEYAKKRKYYDIVNYLKSLKK